MLTDTGTSGDWPRLPGVRAGAGDANFIGSCADGAVGMRVSRVPLGNRKFQPAPWLWARACLPVGECAAAGLGGTGCT